MKRLRIAIVGAGTGRGQSWLSTLRKLSDRSDLYDFCALCEVIEDRARENPERWGVKAYTDLTVLLKDDRPDVLLNATAPDSNPMATGLAAKHGVHVINEIPIAPTLAIADAMVQIAAEHNVKLEITEQVYLWAREQLKRKTLEAGLIGRPVHARLRYTNKADYHGINGVRMLLGMQATRVLGFGGRVPVPSFVGYEGDRVEEDHWDAAAIEFEGGLTCLFEDPPRGGLSGSWDVHGSEGQWIAGDLYLGAGPERMRYPIQHEYTEIDGEKVLEHCRVDTDPPVVFENPFKDYRASDDDEVSRMELLVGFHRAITEDTEPAYGAANARHDLEILFALRESVARDNTWMELPLTEETALEKRLTEEFKALYGHGPDEVEALATVPFPRGGVRWKVAGWD